VKVARAAQVLTLVSVAWGAMAFGAVYPWAYWPLAVTASAAGVMGLFAANRVERSWALWAALVLVGIAILIQVVPLPLSTLESLSPQTLATLRELNVEVAANVSSSHPISIRPAATLLALALFGSFALLMLGTSRALSSVTATTFIERLVIFGAVLALIGIVQRPLFTGRIYGFWTPQFEGSPFGPFVNKNHFAGWMLMGVPLALGLICARIDGSMNKVKRNWRDRLIWLSSEEASRLTLIAAAIVMMTLSLFLTMSRSAISAFALAIVITGWFWTTGNSTASRKAVGTIYLLLLVAVVIAWIGADVIFAQFSGARWAEFNGRRGAWADARRVVSFFPLVGTGLNTYGSAMLLYQRYGLGQHYSAAHNDYLQLAAEGGVLLSVPVLIFVLALARTVRRRFQADAGSPSHWIRAGAVTALVAIALQETVEFSLQTPGNAAFFAVVCGIALHDSQARSRS